MYCNLIVIQKLPDSIVEVVKFTVLHVKNLFCFLNYTICALYRNLSLWHNGDKRKIIRITK